ncbi:MAG TPA: class I SAM-dependent RNA methyltransferase [Blastocatellia bacterium]|nr:class I SAM-dependent RNA methyltransferase [Blastocatellia bacterium]
MATESPSLGDVIELTTERIAYGGEAVGRFHGLAVFVPLAAPGERLRVRITERRPRYARAVIEEVVNSSPLRREPRCPHFGDCGGCQLQHLTYEAQLEAKTQFVREALARIGHLDWPHPIEIRSAAEFGYRDRAQVRIEKPSPEARVRAGFNRAQSHSVCDVSTCPLLVPELDSIFDALRAALGALSAEARPREADVAAGSNGEFVEPELPGLRAGIVRREVLGASFISSPAVFFQANRLLLDELVKEAVGGAAGELAVDLYAGVGLFTIPLARQFARVIGVESDDRAASFARKNISINEAGNARLFNLRVEDWLKNAERRPDLLSGAPDLVLLDPPRQGAAAAVDGIASLKPKLITYVSCDPNTLARDVAKLVGRGYEISQIIAFDLFPQTYHVEAIASLRLR